MKRDPENRIWYAPWKMTLKKDDTYIGNLSFKGPAQDNVVEIGYGILPDQEGEGYTTEAVQAMTQWAFGNADVVFVEAETEPENRASRRILEKCGFVSNGEGQEGPRFVLEKPLTNWMAIYMLFGISIGTTLGTFLGNVGLWHFTVPWLFGWASYIPYATLVVSINYVNLCFSFLLSGLSLLLLLWGKKVFAKNKEAVVIYGFILLLWIFRMVMAICP